jgi:hypothetical protein
MKNAYEVLRFKEMELVRLRKEIDALRTVIPLIDDEVLPERPHGESGDEPVSESESTGTEGPVFATEESGSRLWGFARRFRER